ncbi:MAG TPA: site-specific integrase [Paraburkholderia sp.]|uniref:tyrosine-type recombinase/integrase n=1 Tax=Paraburkholderia sp. TaxID=1926495 RepID=UPI002B49A9E0|nr:site-specific integrase [Paraburkholderia sp.]HKR38875.1 site-specific integrase [Paraburkholderia sp.]
MSIQNIKVGKSVRYRWYFRRVIEGHEIRRTKLLPAGTTRATANSLAAKWDADMYAGLNRVRGVKVTIGDCVRAHIVAEAENWKDAHKRIKILEKWAPEYAFQNALDLHDWSRKFIGYLRATQDHQGEPKRPLVNGTIKNILSYLRAAIRYAHMIGLVNVDQTARMVIPPANNARYNYPTRRQMLTIARACKNRQVRAAIRIAFYSGMRRGEILNAEVTDLGFFLRATKNGHARIVPIHPRIAVLARHLAFSISMSQFEKAWIRARTIAGYTQTRFHDFRHSSASEMINAGYDLRTVGEVLGHLSLSSTQRYTHLEVARLAKAVAQIGKKRDTTAPSVH